MNPRRRFAIEVIVVGLIIVAVAVGAAQVFYQLVALIK
jgi:hypothetical protein